MARPGDAVIADEQGPELVDAPQGAKILTSDQTSALMGSRSGGGHTFNFGDTHIHPVGVAQFTPDQVRQISEQVQQGQQATVDHIVRNFPQLRSDAWQYE